jgi:hypothetical protein
MKTVSRQADKCRLLLTPWRALLSPPTLIRDNIHINVGQKFVHTSRDRGTSKLRQQLQPPTTPPK